LFKEKGGAKGETARLGVRWKKFLFRKKGSVHPLESYEGARNKEKLANSARRGVFTAQEEKRVFDSVPEKVMRRAADSGPSGVWKTNSIATREKRKKEKQEGLKFEEKERGVLDGEDAQVNHGSGRRGVPSCLRKGKN